MFGLRAQTVLLSNLNLLLRSLAMGTASGSQHAREVPARKDEYSITELLGKLKLPSQAVLPSVMKAHVVIEPVQMHARPHLANTQCNSSDQGPHMPNGLAACLTCAMCKVEQVERLAAPCVAHQMYLGDEMSEPVLQYVQVLELVGEHLELVPEVLDNLAIDVQGCESQEQAEHHVAVQCVTVLFRCFALFESLLCSRLLSSVV
jgi:hypothetical protein